MSRRAALLLASSLFALPLAADTGISNVFTLDLREGCARPAAPSFQSSPARAVAGNPFTLSWSPTLAGDPNATYQLDVTTSADCSSNRKRYVTSATSVTLATVDGETATYCAVVRTVTSGGCAGDDSASARVVVEPAPAVFVVVRPQQPREAVGVEGQPPAAGTIQIKNIGRRAASLTLGSSSSLLSPSPGFVPGVAPDQVVSVQLDYDPSSTRARGLLTASLRGSWNDGVEKSVATLVALTTLGSAPTQDAAGSRLRFSDTSEVHFLAAAGQTPAPQAVTLRNTGTSPVRVVPTVGPGGTWLLLTGNDFVTPLEPGETRAYTLSVNRARRATAEGKPPLATYLTFSNADGSDGDRAVLPVYDEEPPAATSGAGRSPLGAGESSLVLSSTARAQGAGAFFLSDGWIRNQRSEVAAAQLFYTPDGQDGLSGDVKKADLQLQPYGTYRLADVLRGLFQVEGGSGHVELRSPAIAGLSARTTVDSLTRNEGGIARFGAEIPTVRSGQGARASLGAGPMILPGIRGGPGSRYRTNLILSETSGAQVQARARLRSDGGQLLSEVTRTVAPYSKLQISFNDSGLFPANVAFEGGSLEVEAIGGSGALAAFATVIDNDSQGYTTRAGRFVAARLGAAPARFAVPAAAHIAGAGGAFFRTNLFLRNGAEREVSFTVRYRKDASATFADPPGSSVAVTIPARAAKAYEDVLVSLFGLAPEAGTAGMLLLEGADVANVVVASETTTPIAGPDDLSRGVSPNTLAAYAPQSPEALGDPGAGAAGVVSHPALEESSRFRTNLILAEIAGQPVEVNIRLVAAAAQGAALAQRTVSLEPFQRLQLSRVIAQLAGPGPDYLDVETTVEWVSGTGRVIAVATKIDNDPDSKRSDIYVLGPSGARQGLVGY